MATGHSIKLPPSFDENGRAIPLSPEQIRQRAALAREALEMVKDIGDEAEQRETLEYLMQALKESRLSDRPRLPE